MDSAMEEGSAIDGGSAIEDSDEGLATEERGRITGTSDVTVLVLVIVVCTCGLVMMTFLSSLEDVTV